MRLSIDDWGHSAYHWTGEPCGMVSKTYSLCWSLASNHLSFRPPTCLIDLQPRTDCIPSSIVIRENHITDSPLFKCPLFLPPMSQRLKTHLNNKNSCHHGMIACLRIMVIVWHGMVGRSGSYSFYRSGSAMLYLYLHATARWYGLTKLSLYEQEKETFQNQLILQSSATLDCDTSVILWS